MADTWRRGRGRGRMAGTLKETDDGGHAMRWMMERTGERGEKREEQKKDGGHVEGDGRWRTRDGEEGGRQREKGVWI